MAEKIEVSAETLRKWLRQAEVDVAQRSGVTTEESVEIKRPQAGEAELRRANEILKAAAALLGVELDRPSNRW